MGAGEPRRCGLYGADNSSGDIWVEGKKVTISSPIDAVKKGIGYLSEDRKRFGLATSLSVEENVVMASLEELSPRSFINRRELDKVAETYVDKLTIRTPSIDQIVNNLSGGNQQKVVIAKWLIKNSSILIFDEPTRGIDVGAKSEIYHLMNELVAEENLLS